MQVGIVSDIHGSLAALGRVWQALEASGLTTTTVLNAGDNVGYGEDPEGCIAFLRAHPNIQTVQGNYDRNVARYPERVCEYQRKWGKSRPAKLAAIRRDSETISPASRAWLLGLPRERTVILGGCKILLTHYAPGGKGGLARWTLLPELTAHAACTDAQVIVCGHTHSPFTRAAGGALFINPGTVGRSFDGGPAYAILTLEPQEPPRAELRQIK